jgi:hypothetical protein
MRPLSPRHQLPVLLLGRAGERPTSAAHAFREVVLTATRFQERRLLPVHI